MDLKKAIANLKVNLIVMIIGGCIIFFANLHTFILDGIGVLYGLIFLSYFLVPTLIIEYINKNVKLALLITKIFGVVATVSIFMESFFNENYYANCRILGWIFLIGGILIVIDANKIEKILTRGGVIPMINNNINNSNMNSNVNNISNNVNNVSYNNQNTDSYMNCNNQDINNNVVYNDNVTSNFNDEPDSVLSFEEDNSNTIYDDTGIVVNGYITNVLYNPEIDKYCLEISYLFEGEEYVFYYRNISRDITYELDSKNLRKINVYLPNNSPDYAQIDEELLMYMVEN